MVSYSVYFEDRSPEKENETLNPKLLGSGAAQGGKVCNDCYLHIRYGLLLTCLRGSFKALFRQQHTNRRQTKAWACKVLSLPPPTSTGLLLRNLNYVTMMGIYK